MGGRASVAGWASSAARRGVGWGREGRGGEGQGKAGQAGHVQGMFRAGQGWGPHRPTCRVLFPRVLFGPQTPVASYMEVDKNPPPPPAHHHKHVALATGSEDGSAPRSVAGSASTFGESSGQQSHSGSGHHSHISRVTP